MKGYTDSQTEELLEIALDTVETGESLSSAFERFAAKTGRAKGSVRNYYYQLVAKARTDEKLKERFPKIRGITVGRSVVFTDEETKTLVDGVENGLRAGKSVRKTVFELAGGDAGLALRYQNKYRNVKKRRDMSVAGDKDGAYRLLADRINGLIERIGADIRAENARLKKSIAALTEENLRLKAEKDKSNAASFFCAGGKGAKSEEVR